MIDGLRCDLRFALRQLGRAPGFVLSGAGLLALGIGATVTIFTVVNAVLLRPPPHVREPERLVAMYTSDFSGPRYGTSSHPDYLDFAADSGALEGLAAFTPRPLGVAAEGESVRAFGELVSENYFQLLGVPMAAGRPLAPGSADSELVIGHDLWRRWFGGTGDVVGRTVRVSGRSFTVVGVAPAGFSGSLRGLRSELWLPLAAARILTPGADRLADRGNRALFLVGRLRPGVTATDAERRLTVVAERLHRSYPEEWTDASGAGRAITVLPERDARIQPQIRGPVSGFLGLLMGVAGLVLLVCCANLANLLLARGSVRRRELAVRRAMGASRAGLVRQLLIEGSVLALIGAPAGVLLSAWATGALAAFRPPLPVPLGLDLGPDSRVVAFTVAITTLSILLSALAPALRATRSDAGSALRGEIAGARQRGVGLRDTLVAVQVAISLVLLTTALLFLASLRNATRIDPGFRTEGLALLPADPGALGYDTARGQAFYAELERRARAMPGVETVALADAIPLGVQRRRRGIEVPGYQPARGEEMELGVTTVGPGYFDAMGMPLVRGRGFDARERAESAPVVVVNESFARRFWPGADPLGRQVATRAGRVSTVIGVVRDARYWSLQEEHQPHFFEPLAQGYEAAMTLVVRTADDPARILPRLGRTARGLEADLAVEPVTMAEHLGYALLPQRVGTVVLGIFAVTGTLLAALGLYAVMSYVVARRASEIGIRLALGARPADVRRLIVGRAMAVAGAGIAVGGAAALAAGRLLGTFLVEVSPTDPAPLAAAAGCFALVALLASWTPAHRAARLDPAATLRSE